MRDPDETTWLKLLFRVYRRGPRATAMYVADLVRKDNYPMYYPFRLARYFISRDEFAAAGVVLKACLRSEGRNHLIDLEYGNWLWRTGKRNAALRFLAKATKERPHSMVADSLSVRAMLSGKTEMSKKYLILAQSLADRAAEENFKKADQAAKACRE